jgi:NADP-dependent 3-hydroxy acid dehydrogenase YdfG
VARDATTASARPVVWVVGASSGIGREIARSFAAIGATVCVSARRGTLLGRLRREIETAGGRAFAVPFDVTDAGATRSAWKTVRAKAGPVDVLVNNAGVTVFKDFLHTSAREFDAIVTTNLLGPSCCIRAVLPDMVRRRRGWVFNILSNAAVKTFEGSAAYTASKAGMLGFGRVLREEVRAHRVRVVSILPGATDTPMWSTAARKKHHGRMMSARGVAEAVVSAYLMPSDVVVDEMIIRPIGGDLE